MTFLTVLATFWLTYAVVNLDGPGKMFVRLRESTYVHESFRAMFQCFWCTSFWVGAFIALLVATGFNNWLLTTLALAGAASIINNLLER